MQKIFNKEEHWKDIMKNTLFKGCEFVSDMYAADQIMRDGEIKGPFSCFPMVKGYAIVVMYIDGKLHSITTRCRRFVPYNDVTSNLFQTGLFPATIPNGITLRNPVKIYGTVATSIEDYKLWLWKNDSNRKPATLERCFSNSVRGEIVTESDLKLVQFIPYTTNMITGSYKDEFENLLTSIGYKVYPWIRSIELAKTYSNPDQRLFDIPEFQEHMPASKLVEWDRHRFLFNGLLVIIDRAVRWRYHFYRRKTFSRHAFMVRYPSECKFSYITEIRSFIDSVGIPRTVIKIEPVLIDGFIIKSTNMVSPKTIDEMKLNIGSRVLMTVKPGGQPHMIKQQEKHKYNVFGY